MRRGPTAWLHRTAFPAIGSTFAPNEPRGSAGELELGVVDVPFAVPNLRCESCDAAPHVRIGWFRTVSNIPHAFAISSFVDELPGAAGRDPKDFLLDLIGPPRLVTPRTTEKYGTYGESIEVHSTVEEWRAKTFTHRHVIRRGDDVLCEGTEVRTFLRRDDGGRLRAIPIPEDIKALCI